MIEVFRTNITRVAQAQAVIEQIHAKLPGHHANFDLQDCDHILRVKCDGVMLTNSVIQIVSQNGGEAEVLPDDVSPKNPDTSNLLPLFSGIFSLR